MLADFSTYLRGRGYASSTIASYTGTLRRFMAWQENTTGFPFDPASVTPLDIADYRRHLQNGNKKPATVNNALDALNAFFTWAMKQGITQTDPTEGVRRLPEQKGAPRWLDRRELGVLVRAVQKFGNTRDQALIMLLLHTGLRISEAVSLKTADVVIRERSGHVVVRRGKGDKYREVPLNITVRRVLTDYLADAQAEWLFPGRKGGPMTARAGEKILEKYSRLAGIDITPHQLRHTFCKMLVDAGESLDRVAVLAGHSNLNTTARYTRPGVYDLERAVEKLAWE